MADININEIKLSNSKKSTQQAAIVPASDKLADLAQQAQTAQQTASTQMFEAANGVAKVNADQYIKAVTQLTAMHVAAQTGNMWQNVGASLGNFMEGAADISQVPTNVSDMIAMFGGEE